VCGQAVCGRGRGRGRASNSKCVESVESVGVEHLREQSVDGRVAQQLEEEEVRLVNKAIEMEMQEMKAGRIKTKSYAEIKKKFNW